MPPGQRTTALATARAIAWRFTHEQLMLQNMQHSLNTPCFHLNQHSKAVTACEILAHLPGQVVARAAWTVPL